MCLMFCFGLCHASLGALSGFDEAQDLSGSLILFPNVMNASEYASEAGLIQDVTSLEAVTLHYFLCNPMLSMCLLIKLHNTT